MLTRAARLFVACSAVAVFGVGLPVAGVAPSACAAEGPRAVLVVDREGGSAPLRMCVAMPDAEVSGLELIRLAGAQYDLQYRFGHGGAAVCQLANVPAERPPDDCLQQGQPFWGYWRNGQAGSWSWSGTGAASTEVNDGDVEGWSWGYGNDGGSHPQPPVTRPGDVCKRTTSPSGPGAGGGGDGSGKKGNGTHGGNGGNEDKSPSGGHEEGGTKHGGSPSTPGKPPHEDKTVHEQAKPGPDKPAREPDRKAARPRHRDDGGSIGGRDLVPTTPVAPSPTTTSLPADATAAGGIEDDEGFPVAGLLALSATAILGTVAGVVARRRRPRKG